MVPGGGTFSKSILVATLESMLCGGRFSGGGRREQREEREVEASHRGRQGWLTEQQRLVLMSVTTRFALLNSSASVCTIHLC